MQNKKTINPAKPCEPNILRTRNCHHRFIKNLLPEKHKDNI